MGIYIIWKVRPPILTTLHVVNGAAVLAMVVLLTVRAGRAAAACVEPANAESVSL